MALGSVNVKMCRTLSVFLVCFSVFIITVSRVNGATDKNETQSELNSGIIGGKVTKISKYPYAVSISSHKEVIGAGALISKTWVITSAQLKITANKKDISIRVGSDYAQEKGCTLKVKKWVNHPKFHGDLRNDVALLKLSKPIPSRCTAKVLNVAKKLPHDGVKGDVIGWGWGTNQKGHIKLVSTKSPVLSYKKCKKHYPELKVFTSSSFCTNGKSGPCQYDQGAPLVYKNQIIGVYSKAYVCGDPALPTIYTDVTKLHGWIQKVIKK